MFRKFAVNVIRMQRLMKIVTETDELKQRYLNQCTTLHALQHEYKKYIELLKVVKERKETSHSWIIGRKNETIRSLASTLIVEFERIVDYVEVDVSKKRMVPVNADAIQDLAKNELENECLKLNKQILDINKRIEDLKKSLSKLKVSLDEYDHNKSQKAYKHLKSALTELCDYASVQ
ncbi:hypothetical protein ACOME3_009097 [Neoechinorhynchus agilis]